MSRYLLAIYEDEGRYSGLPAAEFDDVWRQHDEFVFAVKRAGATVVSGEALGPRAAGWCVRSEGGAPVLVDAPTNREALGGYYVIDARDDAQAIELAGLCPAPFGFVEVRPVMSAASR